MSRGLSLTLEAQDEHLHERELTKAELRVVWQMYVPLMGVLEPFLAQGESFEMMFEALAQVKNSLYERLGSYDGDEEDEDEEEEEP